MIHQNNIYHRFLNLPFSYPKPERFSRPSEKFSMMMESSEIYQPFNAFIESFGLKISNVLEAFYTPPGGGKVPLHTDTPQLPGENDVCKLNFTWGPSDSTTEWYQIKDNSQLQKYNLDNDHANTKFYEAGIKPDIDFSYVLFADLENANLVYETPITKPSLLNVSQLHSTYNPSETENRWSLCFTLLKNGEILTFEHALKIFADYIVEE